MKTKKTLLLGLIILLTACGQVSKNNDGSTSYKYFYSNGKIKKEKVVKIDSTGKEIEYWKFYYENGNLKKEGVEKTGMWIFYSEAGQKESETHFVNDIRDGHAIYFWPNGNKKREGEYKNGKQHGLWTDFKENGDTASILEYIDGELKLF
jgi:antitoxin component YwqK of YwqJK toxin-antitoxin module